MNYSIILMALSMFSNLEDEPLDRYNRPLKNETVTLIGGELSKRVVEYAAISTPPKTLMVLKFKYKKDIGSQPIKVVVQEGRDGAPWADHHNIAFEGILTQNTDEWKYVERSFFTHETASALQIKFRLLGFDEPGNASIRNVSISPARLFTPAKH